MHHDRSPGAALLLRPTADLGHAVVSKKKGGHKVSKKKVVSTEPVDLTPEPITLEPINHNLEAQARIEKLRAMRQAIPNFTIPTSPDATQRLSTAASLPPE